MNHPTIADVKVWEVPKHISRSGTLAAIEFAELPFLPKRTFYVFDVDHGEMRGGHTNIAKDQVVVAMQGIINLRLRDGAVDKTITLYSPVQLVYIPHMIWLDIEFVTKGNCLLALASTAYDPADYIRDYKKFLEIRSQP